MAVTHLAHRIHFSNSFWYAFFAPEPRPQVDASVAPGLCLPELQKSLDSERLVEPRQFRPYLFGDGSRPHWWRRFSHHLHVLKLDLSWQKGVEPSHRIFCSVLQLGYRLWYLAITAPPLSISANCGLGGRLFVLQACLILMIASLRV